MAEPPAAAIDPFRLAPADSGGVELVFVNGRFAASLSSLARLPDGVAVRPLAEAVARAGDAAGLRLGSLVRTGYPFADLNTALFEDGAHVAIAPRAVVGAPIHVLFLASAAGRPVLISPRLVVEAGERAEVRIVESYAGLADGVTFSNAVTEFLLAPGAIVDHVKLQRERDAAFHVGGTFVSMGRGAAFTSHGITLGGRIVRNDIVAGLDGEGAECTLNGLYLADGDRLVDNHTLIDHAQPHCPSHEVYKGILSGRGRAVFNGKIIVRPQAQKTDARQTNKALLLSDDAQINTKPQLEIFADDVKCTHGAAIGQLDEDAFFYLRARGIGAAAARAMLIHAFAVDVLDGIKVEAVRAQAITEIDTRLHAGMP